MNEAFKDMKFYSAPKVIPRAPPPPAPKKDTVKVETNVFIQNPKSLPTNLRDFERPRSFHEQLKLLPKLNYVAPKLLKSKATDKKLSFSPCWLRGSQPNAAGVERHVMLCQGTKLKKFKQMESPLTLVRKPVNLSEAQGDTPEALAKAEQKQIAPFGGAGDHKRGNFQKRTRQIFEHDPASRQLKKREEHPWILENAQGKEELRGTIEQGSTARYMAMVVLPGGGFKVYPVNRLYKFVPRPSYRVYTPTEVEAMLNAKKKDMHKMMADKSANSDKKGGSKLKGILLGDSNKSRNDGSDEDHYGPLKSVDRGARYKKNKDAEDADDLDFDEDFQDDEEMGMEDQCEEAKDIGKRDLKRQSRLHPVSSSSSESSDESDEEEISKNDPSVKRLKKAGVVQDVDSSDDESDDNKPKSAIRKMELPKVVKPKAPLPSKPAPKSSAPSDPLRMTPESIAAIVKGHPGITMKELAYNLKLNHVKWTGEQKQKFLKMLDTVIFKSKDNPSVLQVKKEYL